MNSLGPGCRILHLGSNPSESALLNAELRAESILVPVLHVATSDALRSALAANDVGVVIADLPLPYGSAALELAELQRNRPALRVLFRTGSAGNRGVAGSDSPTVRALREALQGSPQTGQTREEHRHLVEQVVQSHAVQLRLSRRDLWDFEDALRDITQSCAELLAVDRVSLWEVERATGDLACTLAYDRRARCHRAGERLTLPPSYVAALDSAMFLAADDAQHDPRTSALAAEYLLPLGITSMLDAPVRRDGRIVGVLCHEHSGPARHWSILEQCTAAAMAEVVARAFEVRDRRRAEERLTEAEKFEVLGRFTGRLAHDFNNILTVILGNAQLALSHRGVEPQDRELLTQIVQASEDATTLIRQLLAFSRREPGRPEAVDLRAWASQALPMAARLLGSEVRVVEALGSEPLWVRIDPTQLQQVLLNLAANSRDAMPGGGEFRVSLSRSGTGAGAFAHLCVEDTGAGIAPEVLPRIFEPFFTTKEPRLGTGLGLASVREIVRMAGGQVAVSSQPGHGTTFDIALPAALPPAPTPGGPRGGTALLVIPDAALRGTLVTLLRDLGIDTLEAKGAVEALEVVASGRNFDWVAAAQVVGRMDGGRLVRHLRDFRPRVPALILLPKGASVDPDLPLLAQSGITATMPEPPTVGALETWLRQASAPT